MVGWHRWLHGRESEQARETVKDRKSGMLQSQELNTTERLNNNMLVLSCSAAQSCLTLVTPCTVAHQTPLSMEFSRQEY